MKRLMKFSIFESNKIPNHFIKLSSIGTYLDPNNGLTYPMLKNGGYDDDPYPADEFLNEEEETWELLLDEEKRLVNSVWKSCEEIVYPLIDWNLVDDIKDVALANEILDSDLHINIVIKDINSSEVIYKEMYGHDYDYIFYPKFFKNLFNEISNTDGDFSYSINIFSRSVYGGYLPISNKDILYDLVDQVKGMNPDKESKIITSRW